MQEVSTREELRIVLAEAYNAYDRKWAGPGTDYTDDTLVAALRAAEKYIDNHFVSIELIREQKGR